MPQKSAVENLDPPKDEYTIEEVSKMLKVKRETVRRYIRAGRLRARLKPVKGLKKEYRISGPALDRFRRALGQNDVLPL